MTVLFDELLESELRDGLTTRGLEVLGFAWEAAYECRLLLRRAPHHSWDVRLVFETNPRMASARIVADAALRQLAQWDDAKHRGEASTGVLHVELPPSGVSALAAHLRSLAETIDPHDPVASPAIVGLMRAAVFVEQWPHPLHITEDDARVRVERAEAEVARVRGLIDRDRTGLATALVHVKARAHGSYWIVEGRGSYAWNDERYRRETGKALEEIVGIATKALRESGDRASSAFHPAECRRCSECVGQEHHWHDGDGNGDVYTSTRASTARRPRRRARRAAASCSRTASIPTANHTRRQHHDVERAHD